MKRILVASIVGLAMVAFAQTDNLPLSQEARQQRPNKKSVSSREWDDKRIMARRENNAMDILARLEADVATKKANLKTTEDSLATAQNSVEEENKKLENYKRIALYEVNDDNEVQFAKAKQELLDFDFDNQKRKLDAEENRLKVVHEAAKPIGDEKQYNEWNEEWKKHAYQVLEAERLKSNAEVKIAKLEKAVELDGEKRNFNNAVEKMLAYQMSSLELAGQVVEYGKGLLQVAKDNLARAEDVLERYKKGEKIMEPAISVPEPENLKQLKSLNERAHRELEGQKAVFDNAEKVVRDLPGRIKVLKDVYDGMPDKPTVDWAARKSEINDKYEMYRRDITKKVGVISDLEADYESLKEVVSPMYNNKPLWNREVLETIKNGGIGEDSIEKKIEKIKAGSKNMESLERDVKARLTLIHVMTDPALNYMLDKVELGHLLRKDYDFQKQEVLNYLDLVNGFASESRNRMLLGQNGINKKLLSCLTSVLSYYNTREMSRLYSRPQKDILAEIRPKLQDAIDLLSKVGD